ncbi:MAG: hypothetical protein ACXVA9_10600 [Bdellovibrionales bacterium]
MKPLAISLFLVFGWLAQAQETAPPCMARGQVLQVNNEQVIHFKSSTPNGYHDRGHVTGKVTQVFRDATGHNHFEITLAAAPATTVEMVYDQKFGRLPNVNLGDAIEACGDYITSNDYFGGYSPSPDGALVHWIHRADHPGHDNGYIIINGTVYGQN